VLVGLKMAVDLSKLQTAMDNYQQQLIDMSVSPKPTYTVTDNSGNSQNVSWGDYQKWLLEQIKQLNEFMIALSPYRITVRQVSGW